MHPAQRLALSPLPRFNDLCFANHHTHLVTEFTNVAFPQVERDAYLQALARFTLLTDNETTSGTKATDIDTIRTLLLVAQRTGNFLGHSWLDILRCISRLEEGQLMREGRPALERCEKTRGEGGLHLSQSFDCE